MGTTLLSAPKDTVLISIGVTQGKELSCMTCKEIPFFSRSDAHG